MRREFLSRASRITSLPGAGYFAPAANRTPTKEESEGYSACQKLAHAAVIEVAKLLQPGWTERQTATLIDTYLQDHGVQSFFHRAFVWFGERARFDNVKRYGDFLPTRRVVRDGEIYILDVAPIFDGYICDIGYTDVLGIHPEYDRALAFLAMLRRDIPRLFEEGREGGEIWRDIDDRIHNAGYDNIHQRYPMSVLGHRVHYMKAQKPSLNLINFGWQSYFSLLARGLFGQLLNQDFSGDLTGLWAIEPHIGGEGFGAKFEEILLFDGKKARWLIEENPMFCAGSAKST